jgi:hypothetical protein
MAQRLPVRPSYEYIVRSLAPALPNELTYPAATLDKSKATLTHRAHLNDIPEKVPASGWPAKRYATERRCHKFLVKNGLSAGIWKKSQLTGVPA